MVVNWSILDAELAVPASKPLMAFHPAIWCTTWKLSMCLQPDDAAKMRAGRIG
jgi:hypothetical protein